MKIKLMEVLPFYEFCHLSSFGRLQYSLLTTYVPASWSSLEINTSPPEISQRAMLRDILTMDLTT